MKAVFICKLAVFLICLNDRLVAQSSQLIVPQVKEFKYLTFKGVKLESGHTIRVDPKFYEQAKYFKDQVKSQCGIDFIINSGLKGKDEISFVIDSIEIDQPEMYILEIKNQRVVLKAISVRGFINGIQTLLQIFPLTPSRVVLLKSIRIRDFPRFQYRGMHLDVVRHFFPVDFIKKYIDYLTFHKFNAFHWHLTDDQGWRMEVFSYPKLNSIGSWRDSTLIGHHRDKPPKYKKERYGGYYTQKEIREIIDYATVRGINIIPEIDIPGHSRAIIAAYPELSTNPDTTWSVAATWGMANHNNSLAPNEATFKFLKEVFNEVASLFPSEFIHLGGDECNKKWWRDSKTTQLFMTNNNLKNEGELQAYFVQKVAGFLKEKNKKVIGWHEIIEGEIDTSAVIMNWANEAKAVEALNKGFRVIMSPGKPYYFDHYQSKNRTDSLAIHGCNTLKDVYNYDLMPSKITDKKVMARVMGGQGNVWTEYMAYPAKVEYMVFPRMSALSESLWIYPEQKNYDAFLKKLKSAVIPRYRFWNSAWYTNFEESKN